MKRIDEDLQAVALVFYEKMARKVYSLERQADALRDFEIEN
jgi:hypothetical protein